MLCYAMAYSDKVYINMNSKRQVQTQCLGGSNIGQILISPPPPPPALCTVQWMNIYCIYTSTVIVGKSYGTLFYKYSVITNMIDDDLLKDLQ